MLSMDDALEMLRDMRVLAERDAGQAERDGNERDEHFWDGWASGLEVLERHILSDVKTSCFPIGSCTCHPFTLGTPGTRREDRKPLPWRHDKT